MSIPSMAYTVNGVELVPVNLTIQDYIDLFSQDGFDAFIRLSTNTSVDITLYDMVQGTSSVVNISSGTNYHIRQLMANADGDSIIFTSNYAFNMRVNSNASLFYELILRFPFPYYIDTTTLTHTFYYSGTSVTQPSSFMNFYDTYDLENGSHVFKSVNGTLLNYNTSYWSSTSAINTWYTNNNFSNVPGGYSFDTSSTGVRTKYSTFRFSDVSTQLISQAIGVGTTISMTHTSGTGYDYSFWAPLCARFMMPLTVYVDPDIADTVEEYLDLIAGPTTPTQQARINELKDKFDDTLDDLDGAKENIHKDMPDLPSVSDLPEEAIDGMEDASEYVINPFLSIGIVSTLLGVTFIFTVIKILLYGSGPY